MSLEKFKRKWPWSEEATPRLEVKGILEPQNVKEGTQSKIKISITNNGKGPAKLVKLEEDEENKLVKVVDKSESITRIFNNINVGETVNQIYHVTPSLEGQYPIAYMMSFYDIYGQPMNTNANIGTLNVIPRKPNVSTKLCPERNEIKQGEIISVELQLDNLGDDTAKDLCVELLLSPSIKLVSGELSYKINLGPNDIKSLSFSIIALKHGISEIKINKICCSDNKEKFYSFSNISTQIYVKENLPRLQVKKSISKDVLLPGEKSTITVITENIGTGIADKVRIIDEAVPEFSITEGRNEWKGIIREGEIKQFSYVITAKRTASLSLKSSCLYYDSLGEEHTAYSNSVTIYIQKANPRLKASRPVIISEKVFVNQEFDYIVHLSNIGNALAKDITLSIQTNAPLTILSEPVARLILHPNQNTTVQVRLKATKPCTYTISNATLGYKNEEGENFELLIEPLFINVSQQQLPVIIVERTILEKEIQRDQKVTVTTLVINKGLGKALNIKVHDPLSASVQLIDGENIWEGELFPLQSHELHYNLKPEQLGVISLDPVIVNYIDENETSYVAQSTTSTFSIKTKLEVRIIKETSKSQIEVGDELTILTIIENNSDFTLENATIIDEPPKILYEKLSGANSWSENIMPKEKRVFSYKIKSLQTGVIDLPPATILYRDPEGNFRRESSNRITVSITPCKPLVDFKFDVVDRSNIYVNKILFFNVNVENRGKIPIKNFEILWQQTMMNYPHFRVHSQERMVISLLPPESKKKLELTCEAILTGEIEVSGFEAKYSDFEENEYIIKSNGIKITILEEPHEIELIRTFSDPPYLKNDYITTTTVIKNMSSPPSFIKNISIFYDVPENFELIGNTRWTVSELPPGGECESIECKLIPRSNGNFILEGVHVSYESSKGSMRTFITEKHELEIKGEVKEEKEIYGYVKEQEKLKYQLIVCKQHLEDISEKYNNGQLTDDDFLREKIPLEQFIAQLDVEIEEINKKISTKLPKIKVKT